MARLPNPGSDDGTWGTILNDFLGVAHEDDGSLKPIDQSKIADLSADLDAKADTTTQVVAGSGLSGGGDLSTNRTLDVEFGTIAGTAAEGNDSRINGALQRSGGTMTGAITLAADPANALEAATKQYVDAQSAANAWQFNVQSAPYNAAGDGATNDTAAIQAAIDDAAAYAAANNGYAEVLFPSATYLLSSAGRTDRSGNAQLALPVVSGTSNKLTIALVGVHDAASMPHWNATAAQINGVVLKSTWNATDASGSSNEGSVIGGPTTPNGYVSGANFSNCNIVIKGIQIQVPLTARNSDTCGIDLRGMANAHLEDVSFMPNGTPTQFNARYTTPGWTFGIAMPVPGNNDLSVMNNCMVYGATYGMYLGEHLSADRIAVIYCYTGLLNGPFFSSVGQQHNNWIGGASVEACVNGLHNTSGAKIVINAMSVEGITTHVKDDTATATGYIGLSGIISNIVVSDPCGIKVVHLDRATGTATALAMPASAAARRNTYWRDAAIQVNNGTSTVSNVSVDGASILSGPGMVIVPAGKNITLTYSGGTPTWSWTLM